MNRKILVGILTMAVLLLSACGAVSDDEVVSLEPYSLKEESVSDVRGESNSVAGAGTQSSATDSSSGMYADTYLPIVNENEDNTKGYSLIYLDADEVPELVIHDREYESYSIYTIRDNEVLCMADSLVTVELTYYERSGIIVGFDRWNGGGDEGGYGRSYYQTSGDWTLTSEDQALLSYSYNAAYNEEGVYMGTGVTEYFYMGQKIDEETYQEQLRSLGITEGEDEPCMENSYNKEEFIAFLNQ